MQINDATFKDFEDKVAQVDDERGKVRVLVSMFGRETPVELDFYQVKNIKRYEWGTIKEYANNEDKTIYRELSYRFTGVLFKVHKELGD